MTTETPNPTYDAAAKRRTEWINGMRAMVDFFEQHPELKHPYYENINIFVDTKEEMAIFARASGWAKEYNDSWFMLRRTFGDDITLDVNIQRSTVCRQVEVGEKLVPAQPAVPEHVKKVYEWVCDDAVLLDPRRD
jgi:hypothetical protein